jgi:hypothetical protein
MFLYAKNVASMPAGTHTHIDILITLGRFCYMSSKQTIFIFIFYSVLLTETCVECWNPVVRDFSIIWSRSFYLISRSTRGPFFLFSFGSYTVLYFFNSLRVALMTFVCLLKQFSLRTYTSLGVSQRVYVRSPFWKRKEWEKERALG